MVWSADRGSFEIDYGTGNRPTVARIQAPRDRYRNWDISLDPGAFAEGIRISPAQKERLINNELWEFEKADRIPSVADLVVIQTRDDGLKPLEFLAINMIAVEARRIDSHGPPLMEVILVDFRARWGLGQFHGDFNRAAESGGVLPPIANLRELVRLALQELPGRPDLVRFPELLVGGAGAQPSNLTAQVQPAVDTDDLVEVRSWGARAIEALDGLLEAHNLTPAYAPWTGDVSVWRRGFGKIGNVDAENRDQVLEMFRNPTDTTGPFTAANIPQDRNRLETRIAIDAAFEVRMLGPRKIYSVQVDYLDPVITFDENAGASRIRRIIEVTIFGLRALASGIPPGEVELLQAPLETITVTAARVPAAVRPLDLVDFMRLPLASSTWPEELRHVAANVRTAIGSKLGRVFRIPKRYRHLLPMLKRAERFPTGERRPVTAYAYTWEPARTSPTPEELEAARGDLKAELIAVDAELHRVREQLERIAYPDLKDVQQLMSRVLAANPSLQNATELMGLLFPGQARLRGLSQKQIDILLGSINDPRGGTGDLDTSVEVNVEALGDPSVWVTEGNLDFLPGDLGRQLEIAYQLLAGGDIGEPPPVDLQIGDQSLSDYLRSAMRWGRSINSNFTGVAENIDAVGATEEELRRVEQQLLTERRRILEQLDPGQMITEQLEQLTERQKEIVRRTGVEDLEIAAQIEGLQGQLEQVDDPLEQERVTASTLTRTVFVNLPRKEVPVRVLDADEGLIELVTPLPPGWLADPTVPHPGETFLAIMPVKIVFGSWNIDTTVRPVTGGFDVGNREEIVDGEKVQEFTVSVATQVSRPNELINAAMFALRREASASPEVAATLDRVHGSVFPIVRGDNRTEFTFTRDDRSGSARVGEFPQQLVDGDLQELISLPTRPDDAGRDNREEILERARGVAGLLLDSPIERLSGSVVLLGPHQIPVNGVITAVRLSMEEDGIVNTTLFFDPEAQPNLSTELKRLDQGGALSLQFGLDVDAFR